MMVIQRSALLATPAEQVFHLINDVEAYPEYLEGCKKVKVLFSDESSMLAMLHLSKAGLSLSLTTRNTLFPFERIEMQLEDGPFTKFSGAWTIQALNESASKLSLHLEFEMKSSIGARALEVLFRAVGDKLVDAICKRAEDGDA